MAYTSRIGLALLATLAYASCGGDDRSLARLGPDDVSPPAATPTDSPRTPSPDGEFSIDLRFTTAISDELRQGAERAAQRWSEVIRNDLADTTVDHSDLPADCRPQPEDGTTTVDDVVIVVRVIPIDGRTGTLAAAGPCVIRNSDLSPLVGGLDIDQDDAQALQNSTKLDDVLLHEMGHVLGIGTLWRDFTLLRNPSVPDQPGADTHFDGPASREAFASVGGATYRLGEAVPVENSAQRGSADGHWRESVLENELMTPGLSGGEAALPLSLVTIASLEDLGIYSVDRNAADPYQVPPTFLGLRLDASAAPDLMQGEVSPSAPLMINGCALRRPSAVAHEDGSIRAWQQTP